jgi:hypothetical protein
MFTIVVLVVEFIAVTLITILVDRILSTKAAVVALCLCLIALGFIHKSFIKSIFTKSPPPSVSLPPTPAPPVVAPSSAKKTGHVLYSNPHPTPCSMTVGTYYPNPLMLPGGLQLKRPVFYYEGNYETAFFWKNDSYLVLFELMLTNRGEESVVKNWKLCLLDDGKPVRFDLGEIPDEGILLQATGEKITKEDSLPERLIRNPRSCPAFS